jgi:MarR family transcriptional regulator for hemolysin
MHRLTRSIVACGHTLSREKASLLRPLGLTVPHYDVLEMLVEAKDGVRPSAIAETLVFDPSSTTYLIDQMAKRGWISRRKETADRRAYRVEITAAGRRAYTQAINAYRHALRALHDEVHDRDVPTVLTAIEAIRITAPAAVSWAAIESGTKRPKKSA